VKLTIKERAKVFGVTHQTLNNLVDGRFTRPFGWRAHNRYWADASWALTLPISCSAAGPRFLIPFRLGRFRNLD
jgi:hypothetical protein